MDTKDLEKKKNSSEYRMNYAKEKYKRVPLDLPKEQYERLKKYSERKKLPVNKVIKQAIENEISGFQEE